MLRFTCVAALALALVASTESAASTSSEPSAPAWVLRAAPYSPTIDPANFAVRVDNAYFPLSPGTSFHFDGVRDRTAQTDDVVVTRKTKIVLGVKCAGGHESFRLTHVTP